MKKSDIGLITVMYGIVAVFFYMTMQLKVQARIYPLFVMAILFILISAYLAQCIIKAKGVKKIIDDLPNIFKGFVAKQFVVVVVFSVLYLALIGVLGFYCATVIYLVATLFMLKVPTLHIAISAVSFVILVYGAFTTFLRVPLPTGLIF